MFTGVKSETLIKTINKTYRIIVLITTQWKTVKKKNREKWEGSITDSNIERKQKFKFSRICGFA